MYRLAWVMNCLGLLYPGAKALVPTIRPPPDFEKKTAEGVLNSPSLLATDRASKLESRQESDEYDVPRSIPIKCFCFMTPCPRVVATVARPGVVWQQVLHRRVEILDSNHLAIENNSLAGPG